jgi:hypothetical protein
MRPQRRDDARDASAARWTCSILVVAALALLAGPSAADGAATWLPSRIADPAVTNQALTGDTDPVFDRDGTMIIVTERYNAGQATYLNHAYVRPPGGPVVRTKLSDDSSVPVDIALDPGGGVAVTWMVGSDIKIRRRPPGGSFGPTETVPTGVTAFRVQMELGPGDDETFALTQGYANTDDAFHERLLAFRRSGPGVALGTPQVITPNDLDSENGRLGSIDLHVGPSGAAALAYGFQAGYPGSSASTLYVARRGAAGADFGAGQELAPATNDPERPTVLLDAAGRATLTFTSSISGQRRARVANAPADTGDFTAPAELSDGPGNPNHNYARLALAPDGSAVAGFGGGGTQDQWVARRGPSPADPALPPVAFEAPQQVDGGFTDPEPPEVAIAPDGVAYAVVRSGNVFNSDLDAWRSPGPGQLFARTRVADAAAGGDAFEYGIGSALGNAAVAYKGKEGNNGQVTLVLVPFDGVAPTVSLTGPGALPAGQPGTFAAAPFDYWGPVTTTIDHDDGAAGTPHAYATAGAHTATAKATDLAGFAATATTTTSVIAAPPVPAAAPPAGAGTGAAAALGGTGRVAGRRAPGAARVIELPSSRRCVSRRRFRIRLHEPDGSRLVSALVRVNGRQVRAVRGRRLTAAVDLRGLPRGRFRVSITVRTSAGRRITAARRYRTCTPKRRSGAVRVRVRAS